MRENEPAVFSTGKKGFSLIEILLVVILLSIVAVLIIPNFSQSYKSLLLSKTTESLADLMRYAQSRSVMNNHPVNLRFEEDFSGYQVLQFDGESNSFQKISNRLGQFFEVPLDIKVSSETLVIGFYPDGTIDPVEVQVCSDKKCYSISSKIQRGFIKVIEKQDDN